MMQSVARERPSRNDGHFESLYPFATQQAPSVRVVGPDY